MRDELQVIDVFERIRNCLLGAQPQLGEVCTRRIQDFAASHPLQYYKERFLAALAGTDARSPSMLRELSRAVRRAESAPEEFHRDIVAEDTPPFYARMAKSKRKSIVPWLNAMDAFGSGNTLAESLRKANSLNDALELVRQLFPDLPALDQYRVLKAWDYPVLLPSPRRQAFLYRLGFLPEKSTTIKSLRAAADAGEGIARTCREPLQTIDLLFGVYAGDEPGQPADLARCGMTPQCERCCVAEYCEYRRYAHKPAEPRMTIKKWDPKQRPRERLARVGAEKLSDAELLAILLRTGTAKLTVLEVAQKILRRFEGLPGMDAAALAEMCAESGIGEVKAVTLKAAFELGRRLAREREERALIGSSGDIFRLYHHRFLNKKVEEFHLICMDTKHRIIRESMISQGSLASSIVHPREAFKDAIRNSAASVIFVHNHPSGDPTPSRQDEEVTVRLQDAAKILGITMLDHIIVGQGKYYSFQAEQVMEGEEPAED